VVRKKSTPAASAPPASDAGVIQVRRIHRRDLNRTWEFLKRVFRAVNRETVEYQRPRTKKRFLESYEEEGIEQLLFEIKENGPAVIVGYAECAYEVLGSDNWINERYFENRDMRPLFVEEIAIHPDYQGRGIGSFVIEQLEHLARVHGCTHLVLEVAENNRKALKFYRARSFSQLDAAIFLAKKVVSEPELLPPRVLGARSSRAVGGAEGAASASSEARLPKTARGASKLPAMPMLLPVETTAPARPDGSPALPGRGRGVAASRSRSKKSTAK
jgi:ribosomal protein S18 acetylase RimI-like enzyme